MQKSWGSGGKIYVSLNLFVFLFPLYPSLVDGLLFFFVGGKVESDDRRREDGHTTQNPPCFFLQTNLRCCGVREAWPR